MRYFYTITTQHTGRTGGQICASQSGIIEVGPEETQAEVLQRIRRSEEDRVGMDRTAYSILFYRLVPNELTRDR